MSAEAARSAPANFRRRLYRTVNELAGEAGEGECRARASFPPMLKLSARLNERPGLARRMKHDAAYAHHDPCGDRVGVAAKRGLTEREHPVIGHESERCEADCHDLDVEPPRSDAMQKDA